MISVRPLKINVHSALFWIFLLGGFIARCYHFTEIPLTNDELSALNRLNYPSFGEMLKQAVWTDGHPAGVQTFLWSYTHLFGNSQAIIKLPFLLMGCASLPLFYLAAKKLCNANTALFVLASLAFLQYPIAYTQTIRPYSSGQFLAALTLYIWSYWLTSFNNSKKSQWKWTIFLAIGIALSWSNHYFSAFFAFLLLPLSWAMVPASRTSKSFIPWVISSLIYSVQWPIFLHHLQVGSPGWLPTPTVQTLCHHAAYTFQFSWVSVGLLLFSIAARLYFKVPFSKKSYVFLAAYLLPITLTYVYSLWRAPLFQDSVFVFSLVFLFLFLGDMPAEINARLKSILWGFTLAFASVNAVVLIKQRQHYSQFYTQGYAHLVKSTYEFEDTAQVVPVWVMGFEPYFFQYYQNHFQYKTLNRIRFLREIPKNCCDLFCNNRENEWPEMFIIAKAIDGPTELMAECQYRYPYIYKLCAFGSEVTLFRKHPLDNGTPQSNFLQKESFTSTLTNVFSRDPWSPKIDKHLPFDSKFSTDRYWVQLEIEKPSNSLLWDSIQRQVSVDFRISTDDKELRFVSAATKFLDSSTNPPKWVILAATDGYHFEWPRYQQVGLQTYVTNPNKLPLKILRFKVNVCQGNPYVYSLINDF